MKRHEPTIYAQVSVNGCASTMQNANVWVNCNLEFRHSKFKTVANRKAIIVIAMEILRWVNESKHCCSRCVQAQRQKTFLHVLHTNLILTYFVNDEFGWPENGFNIRSRPILHRSTRYVQHYMETIESAHIKAHANYAIILMHNSSPPPLSISIGPFNCRGCCTRFYATEWNKTKNNKKIKIHEIQLLPNWVSPFIKFCPATRRTSVLWPFNEENFRFVCSLISATFISCLAVAVHRESTFACHMCVLFPIQCNTNATSPCVSVSVCACQWRRWKWRTPANKCVSIGIYFDFCIVYSRTESCELETFNLPIFHD